MKKLAAFAWAVLLVAAGGFGQDSAHQQPAGANRNAELKEVLVALEKQSWEA